MVRGERRARRDAGTEPELLGRLALPAFLVGQAVRPAEHGPELTAIAADAAVTLVGVDHGRAHLPGGLEAGRDPVAQDRALELERAG